MNGPIWKAIKAKLRSDPEWKRTCGTLHRGKPKRQVPAPHVIWYDNMGGESFDAFGEDVGRLIGQFTFVSGKDDEGAKVDAMIRATHDILHTKKLTNGDMLVGWMHLSRTPRVIQEDGTYDAQLDAEVTFQGATQVPAFPGVA